MAQKTNLNVSPYFDDFDAQKEFYKVLFNPGKPIQARELNNIQSILQNQIESFGSHIFKEGSVVIPGNTTYDSNFYSVKLNPTSFGVNISAYINQYVGKLIEGQISGVTATVQKVEIPDSINGLDYVTLYVKYIDSDNDFNFNPFQNGESLVSSESIVYGNTTIASGTPFASLIPEDATSTGSAVSIDDGIYFVRGTFANVSKQTIILDYYSNTPSYRVGLKVTEEIVTAKDDASLYDNAKGFTNYAAPGADRFKINLSLSKKTIDSVGTDTDFIEILRIENGEIKKVNTKTQYSVIRDYLAQRTFDESGNYSVEPFKISLHNSLNDRLGNDGLFFDGQKTESGGTPSDDLMCIKLSPGKAYVKGYDIEKSTTTILDVSKPRETQSVENVNVPFEMGNLVRINNITGSPKQNNSVELHSVRRSSSGNPDSSTKIGDAKVYNFRLTDAAYSGASTNWDLYLYDIQTYTTLVLNQSLSASQLPLSSYVKGKSSGASGYASAAGNDTTTIKVRQTSGTFIVGEQIIINGLELYPRSIAQITVYDSADIKQVYQPTSVSGFTTSFIGDSILDRQLPIGFNASDTINISAGGVVTSPGKVFNTIKPGSIIRYQSPSSNDETFNVVSSVSSTGTSMTVSAVTTVNGVCNGTVGVATNVSFSLGIPKIRNSDKGYLYAELPNTNVSQVNLNSSVITFSAQSTSAKTVSSEKITLSVSDFSLPSGLTTALFAPFDEERYSVHYTDGTTQSLTSDQFSLSSNQVVLSNLTNGKVTSSINATFVKNGVQSKQKQFNRSGTINVIYSKFPESGTGISTSINDGLVYNQYYGLRVQDDEISLNYPDVSTVVAVYESLDTSNPTLDTLSFDSILNIGNNAIIGENILGNDSGCVARVVTRSTNSVGIVYLNSNRFNNNEVVTFQESNIVGDINFITPGNYSDITNRFSLDKGQKEQYYDYSKLIRKEGETAPSKRLLVVFDYYSVPSTDNGDVFTSGSYNKEQFTSNIPLIGNNIRATDTLDFRPRVSVFSGNTSSPFDFPNRDFSSSIKLNLTPNESTIIGYDYYVGRVDKIYLSKTGEFVYLKGTSSINPQSPSKTDDLMELGTITLPPYLYSVKDAVLSLVDNRRYTMRDIGLIENRVKNLERVTSLSLLELSTQTLQIQDSDGFNRFKTGFFVDNFEDSSRINGLFSSVEIDSDSQEMRPVISRNSLKNYLAPAQNITNETVDLSTNYELLDSNVQKTGTTVTLKYESEKWISQPLATQVENVNPFHVVSYTGTIKLSPERDNWVRTVQLPDKTISVTDYVLIERDEIELRNRRRRVRNDDRVGQRRTRVRGVNQRVNDSVESTTETSVDNILVESSNEEYMRSRNTEFSISNLKPHTRYYQFLDGNGSVDFIPKLIEISNSVSLQNYGASSAFTVGETVCGYDSQNNKIISFRVAKSNHKFGTYNSPTTTFNVNPYIKDESLPSEYSASSKVLNVDTFSLSEEAQGLYSGYLVKGAKLIGQSSGSIAYVKDLRLISDSLGDLIGSFFIRDPNTSPAPDVRINTGTKTYKVTSSPTNETAVSGSTSVSTAETNYASEGILELYERTITNRTTETTTRTTTTRIRTVTTRFIRERRREDPLAQTFTIDENEPGAFLTSIDLFFYKKDTNNNPLTVEIRNVELGTPASLILGNPVTLRPDEINISDDASAVTKVTFDYPIYLAPGLEYAIVLLAPESIEYEVFIAEMGKKTIQSANLPDASASTYSQQFAMGSLFKSQNGSIWTANQYQDMKFTLYRANFVTDTPSTAYFYNPTLNESNGYIKNLQNNPITALPKLLSVGITTTTNSGTIGILTTGRKISESLKTYNYGYIVGTGCSASSVGVTTGGFNYVTDTNVSTFNVIGNGSGLTLNITATDGKITNATIVNPGNGYAIGDVVGIVTSSVSSNSGRGATITITGNNNGVDTLYLTNVQGESFTDTGNENLIYYNDSNAAVTLGSIYIRSSTPVGSVNSGNFIKVNHFNHGMYAANNKVSISGVLPTVIPTTLSQSITASSTSISVASTANFVTFEGKAVSGSNPGYAIVENEIIRYESIGSGTLETITRAQLSTLAVPHDTNAQVYKYEFNGVSLRRINTTHDISDVGLDIDSYYIEIDRELNGVDRSVDGTPVGYPQLSFATELNSGGNKVFATENIQYDSIIPFYNIVSPTDAVSVSAKIRSVSGTSVSGNEVSFTDLGYEDIQLNSLNQLSSTRIVCSKANEDTYLTALPRNKSFTTTVTLQTTNKYVSPQIFLDSCFTDFHSNRINSPISNYSTDSRVNSLIDDPHSSVYVSNTVRLAQPATSLKVILSAYRHSSADFRLLYSLIRPDSSEVDQAFELFPGYDNLTVDNNNDGYLDVVDPANNSGLPDVFVRSSKENEFLEYEFSVNNVGEFVGYAIKIVMSSTNQAYPPRFADLRSIAIR